MTELNYTVDFLESRLNDIIEELREDWFMENQLDPESDESLDLWMASETYKTIWSHIRFMVN